MTMMMPFICSFRNKNAWVHPLLIKKAHLMMLLHVPYGAAHDVSFSPSLDLVLHLAPTSPPPSEKMMDTDITLPPTSPLH
jgi:hypothetical protein